MIISQNGAVDLIPEYNRALRPIFCVSEGDANSRTINLTVTSAGEVFTIPEGAEVYVAGKKQDNTIFTYQCAFSGYIVSFPIAEQMSAANGLVLCELQIVVAGDPLGSANFCYWVEPSPIANGSSSESDLNIFEQAIAALGGYEYLTSEVSVLSARMDQFARLPDGSLSTAADAELADIRVKASGETATTAGDAVREQISALSDEFDFYITNGNNLLPLHDYSFTYRGVTLKIENGVVSLTGTSTNPIRIKISGTNYEMVGTAKDEWESETIHAFEVGKTYSMHDIVISGELPSTVGASLRGLNGEAVISTSNPEATLETTITYAMLYIPKGVTLAVSYVPMFIEGAVDDSAYFKALNKQIVVDAEQIIGGEQYDVPDISRPFIYNSNMESAIKFPTAYNAYGTPTPLIILCHGLSSTISASSWGGADMLSLVTSFTLDGYAVIDVNQVTTQDWCNPALIEKYVTAIRDATTRYNIKPCIIYAESMGGLIGLCLSKMYEIRCVVIGGMRLDFAKRYSQLSAENQAIVDANLGFTDGYDDYIAAGYDKTVFPYVDADGNKINSVSFPPTFFIIGSADLTIKEESLAKIEQIRRGGTITKSVEYVGDHHSVCYLQATGSYDDAIAWMRKWC